MIIYFLLISLSIYIIIKLGLILFNHFFRSHNIHGELSVNGEGKVGIGLCHPHRPKAISVHFSNEHHSHPCHPCNPHHDRFHWELVEECGEFRLFIFYNVSNCREITYKVIY